MPSLARLAFSSRVLGRCSSHKGREIRGQWRQNDVCAVHNLQRRSHSTSWLGARAAMANEQELIDEKEPLEDREDFPLTTLPRSTVNRVAFVPNKEDTSYKDKDRPFVEQYRLPRRKTIRPSASGDLIRALGDVGREYMRPERFAFKLDLSYYNPRSVWARRSGEKMFGPETGPAQAFPNVTVLSTLVRYVKHLPTGVHGHEDLATHGLPVPPKASKPTAYNFSEAELTVLRRRGYEPSDVQFWASLITSRKLRATLGSPSYQEKVGLLTRKRLPPFVFLFLLRRKHMTVRQLSILIEHAQMLFRAGDAECWYDESRDDKLPPVHSSDTPIAAARSVPIDDHTAIIIIIRLIRRARHVWPALLLRIVSLFTEHVDQHASGDSAAGTHLISGRRLSYLGFVCNRLLSLSSLRSSLYPLRTITENERAVFHILRFMADHRPPLVVTQEGYRAVIVTQLARRKTAEEREWANLKAESWPPWKEAKTGIDEEKSIETGWSGAVIAIRRMQEAGYSIKPWEMMAKVLAGWDTDESPTIQTRSLVSSQSIRPSSDEVSLAEYAMSGDRDHHQLWAARTRATRTVEEAWACFLQSRIHTLSPAQSVYTAMFEKLAYEGKMGRQGLNKLHSADAGTRTRNRVTAGDAKEVFPAPVNPQEAIYIPSPPPSMEELFYQMVESHIQPSGYCLELLVRHASSVPQGLKYLSASAIAQDASVLSHFTWTHDNVEKLSRIPDQIFAAFLRLLCRRSKLRTSLTDSSFRQSVLRDGLRGSHNQLMHAFRLVSARKSLYHPAWNALLEGLTWEQQGIAKSAIGDSSTSVIMCFESMQEVVRRIRDLGIDLDTKGFHYMCLGLTHAVLAEHKIPDHKSQGDEVRGLRVEDRVSIKHMFQRLVGTEVHISSENTSYEHVPPLSQLRKDSPQQLPRLFVVPAPANLHAYVRCLGFLEDYAAIKQLLVWMVEHKSDLEAVADNLLNGKRMLRKIMVATRVFLELRSTSSDGTDKRREEIIGDVRDTLDGLENWGGWPTDDEVDEYRRKGRFNELGLRSHLK